MRKMLGALVFLSSASLSSVDGISYAATNFYHSTSCRGPPDYISFFGGSCSEAKCPAQADSPPFFTETACNIQNTASYTASQIGYAYTLLYVRVFEDDACTSELYPFAVRVYDGNCIPVGSGSQAFSAGSDGTVKMQSYNTSDCTGPASVKEWASGDTDGNACRLKTKVKLYQPDDEDYIATTYFSDSSCKTPNRISFTEPVEGETVTSTACSTDPAGLHYSRDQDSISDVAAYAKKIFGAQTTYVLKQVYAENKCLNRKDWEAYRPDGCIDMSASGKSVSRDLKFGNDGTLTIRTFYDSATCTQESEDDTVPKSDLDGQCLNGKRYYLKAVTTTVPTPTPTTTTAAPTQSANVRQSSSNVIALSIAVIATLVAAVAASTFMA